MKLVAVTDICNKHPCFPTTEMNKENRKLFSHLCRDGTSNCCYAFCITYMGNRPEPKTRYGP